jgi:ubiquinone/menaquinone biosynthesis C-methylase UbiE
MSDNNFPWWSKIIEDPIKPYRNWFSEERRYLFSNIRKNSYVLDIGCGDGRTIKEISKLTERIVGVDNDIKVIKLAKRNLEALPKTKIILADARAMPFGNSTFDYVICVGTFGNFESNKYKILKEMKRVLKPNGKIIISVYSEDALNARLSAYKKIGLKVITVKRNGTVLYDRKQTYTVSEQFSNARLLNIFKKVGIRPVNIKKVDMAYLCKLSKSG